MLLTAKRIMALAADIRSSCQRLAAAHQRRRRSELESYFAGAADRFELERRERAWTRWHSSDGSLLGP